MDQLDVVAQLRAMPERLQAAFAAAGAGAANRVPAPGEWPASEILAHIRAVDAILAPFVFLLTVLDDPAFPGVDERELAEHAGYGDDEMEIALTTFALKRRELIQLLERLDGNDWQRASTHPAYGRFTIADYARHLAAHEAEHFPEIERALQGVATIEA